MSAAFRQWLGGVHSGTRRVRLEIETLEARALLATSPLGGVAEIINGTPTTAFPSVGIVGDATGLCSGTLIDPTHVLTAAHCLFGDAPGDVQFTLGGTVYSASRLFVHPSYRPNRIGSDGANDLGIMELSTPITTVAPSPIYRITPRVGQLLTLVGFGAGGTGNTGADGTFGIKRVGTTPIGGVTPRLITWSFDSNQQSNTAPGDSGGPAFLKVGDVYYVAGVTSGGVRDDAALGDFSFDTRVDAYASWIDTTVGQPATPPVNPADNQRFVMHLFQDLLGRPADAVGLKAFTGLLNQGGTRTQVVLGVVQSTEYHTRVVQGLYSQLLGRPADNNGLLSFVSFLGNGGQVEDVEAAMLSSPEYLGRHGNTTAGFLDGVFRDVLGRPIDPFGQAAFQQALARGSSLRDVALAVLQSNEGRQHEVGSLFQQLLHRNADGVGLAVFAGALQQGMRLDDVIAAIASSDEYFRRT